MLSVALILFATGVDRLWPESSPWLWIAPAIVIMGSAALYWLVDMERDSVSTRDFVRRQSRREAAKAFWQLFGDWSGFVFVATILIVLALVFWG